MDYTVRPYRDDDYDFVWDLHIKENKSYIDHHLNVTIDVIRDWFNQGIARQRGFILEQEGKPIGCYFISENNEYTKLGRFFLIDKMHGKGIGSKLLEAVLKEFATSDKPFQITVWEDHPVQEFWHKKGFVYVSTDEDKLMTMVYRPIKDKV